MLEQWINLYTIQLLKLIKILGFFSWLVSMDKRADNSILLVFEIEMSN